MTKEMHQLRTAIFQLKEKAHNTTMTMEKHGVIQTFLNDCLQDTQKLRAWKRENVKYLVVEVLKGSDIFIISRQYEFDVALKVYVTPDPYEWGIKPATQTILLPTLKYIVHGKLAQQHEWAKDACSILEIEPVRACFLEIIN